MTSNEPKQNPSEQEIELLVSKVIDRDIDPSDIPADVRSDVTGRASVAAALREQLLRTIVSESRRDLHISTALAVASRSRQSVFGRLAVSRNSFAIAASLAFLVAGATLTVRQFGSGKNDVVFEATATAPGDESSSNPVDAASDSSSVQAVDQKAVSEASDISGSPPDAQLPPPEFFTPEDIAAFVAGFDSTDVDSDETTIPSRGIDPSESRCVSPERVVRAVLPVKFLGQFAELHIVGRNGFIVYDPVDCEVIVDRADMNAVEPSG